MIEISHNQAQRLLRKKMDTRLPEEQWAMLHAHLEACAECRAYGDRLGRIEKGLRRTLRTGWDSIPGPRGEIAAGVAETRQRRAQFQQRGLKAAAVSAALALFFLFGGPGWVDKVLHPVPDTGGGAGPFTYQATARPSATPIPIAQPGDFPDVIVYEGRAGGKPDGKSQLYLLNPGAGPVSLSDAQFNDRDPAWSPDGEWIAFLSDRSGKPEVFVTNLTTSQVVQITNEPDVTWLGPLSWSADGKNIALTGLRDAQGGQRWVYLAPLDGSGALTLAGTRGSGFPEFSPYGLRLAFTYDSDGMSGVKIVRIDTNEQASASWLENSLNSPPAPGSALDWSADGASLTYVAAVAPDAADFPPRSFTTPNNESFRNLPRTPQPGGEVAGSQVLTVSNLNDSIALFNYYGSNFRLAESRWPSAFRAVTWSPGGDVVYLEENTDDRANDQPGTQKGGGCWTIHSRANNGSSEDGVFSVGSLCVDGGLDRGSWSADNRWLVVLGHLPGQNRRGLYAVRMPGRSSGLQQAPITVDGTPVPRGGGRRNLLPSSAAPGEVLHLADEPFATALPRVRPRARTFGQRISIEPRPAANTTVYDAANPTGAPTSATLAQAKPSDLSQRPGGPRGQIVYSVQNNAVSVVVSANPDGTGGRVLTSSSGVISCTRFSPDGSSVAMVQRPPNSAPEFSGTGGASDLAPVTGGSAVDAAPLSPYEDIYVMPAAGGDRRLVNHLSGGLLDGAQRPTMGRYGCPVWSPRGTPGGPYLAAVMITTEGTYLAVIPVDGSLPRYARVYGVITEGAGPVWSADGATVYLAQVQQGDSIPSLLAVGVPEDPESDLQTYTLTNLAQWRTFHGLAAAPQGNVLAVMALRKGTDDMLIAQISPIDARNGGKSLDGMPFLTPNGPVGARVIGREYARAPGLDGALAWMENGRIGIILRGRPTDRVKAMIAIYDLGAQRMTTLAEIPDTITGAAWSADGRYMLFSAESGLWGLDIEAAERKSAVPVWLSPQPVQDLDWK